MTRRAVSPSRKVPARRRPARRRADRRSRIGWGRVAWMLPLAILLLSGLLSGIDAFFPPGLPQGGAAIVVTEGRAFAAVARQLVDSGLARSVVNLTLWSRLTETTRAVRAGRYVFDEPASLPTLLARLRSGEGATASVTIPEGSTILDVAQRLAAAGLGTESQYLSAMASPGLRGELDLPASGFEGYLFPDTYRIAPGSRPEDILRRMVERFRQEATQLDLAKRAGGLSLHEVVTLASVVEKETAVAAERPRVAAVFRNRLQRGMKLQADPTAVYGRPRGTVPAPADLAADTPHNTYRRAGLPAGPICSPGRAAVEGVLAASPTEEIYFVARGDGSHVFSRTLEEHNQHVAELRRLRRRQP